MGCWSNGTTPGLQPGNRGSIPRRSTSGTGSRFGHRKGKPIGDGIRLEIGRAMSLEGSTPSPSAQYRFIGRPDAGRSISIRPFQAGSVGNWQTTLAERERC